MSNPREYWGLDLETSGTTHEDHVPIQLGLTSPTGETWTWLIGGWDWADEQHGGAGWLWDEESALVHNISKTSLAAAYWAEDVDLLAKQCVIDNSNTWKGQRKPVGWNVGSFDMPFVRKHLPTLASQLSYQSTDLNAAAFLIADAQSESVVTIKAEAKNYAEALMTMRGWEPSWHDAGYDSAAALLSWDYLKERARNGY